MIPASTLVAALDNAMKRIRALEARHMPANSLHNILTNGGFETWVAGLPSSWTVVGGAGSTLVQAQDTVDRAPYSLSSDLLTFTYVSAMFLQQALPAVYTGFTVAVSARVKASVKRAIRLEMGGTASVWHSGSGQWETITLVAPGGALAFGLYASGQFHVDNVMVVQGPAPVDYIATTSS